MVTLQKHDGMTASSCDRVREFSPVKAWGLLMLLIGLATVPNFWAANSRMMPQVASSPVPHDHFRVDINQASVAEFQTLPAIGPTLAARIVEYRQQHGPFGKLEELRRVRGVGDVIFEQFRHHLTLNQPAPDPDPFISLIVREERTIREERAQQQSIPK